MKISLIAFLSLGALFSTSCEQQKWEDTKKFHEEHGHGGHGDHGDHKEGDHGHGDHDHGAKEGDAQGDH